MAKFGLRSKLTSPRLLNATAPFVQRREPCIIVFRRNASSYSRGKMRSRSINSGRKRPNIGSVNTAVFIRLAIHVQLRTCSASTSVVSTTSKVKKPTSRLERSMERTGKKQSKRSDFSGPNNRLVRTPERVRDHPFLPHSVTTFALRSLLSSVFMLQRRCKW